MSCWSRGLAARTNTSRRCVRLPAHSNRLKIFGYRRAPSQTSTDSLVRQEPPPPSVAGTLSIDLGMAAAYLACTAVFPYAVAVCAQAFCTPETTSLTPAPSFIDGCLPSALHLVIWRNDAEPKAQGTGVETALLLACAGSTSNRDGGGAIGRVPEP